MNNEFLMRRIVYSPTSVKIYCDITIRILQEIYFNSIIYLPKAIFDKKKFTVKNIASDYIEISLAEWTEFQLDIINLLKGVNNESVIDKMFQNMSNLNKLVDVCLEKESISSEDFYALTEGMAYIDSYAVFNMFLNIEEYNNRLNPDLVKTRVEDIMFCAFEPHRVLLRKKKIEMAIKYAQEKDITLDVEKYMQKYMFFEEFEKWLFSPEKYKSDRFLLREVKGLCKNHSESELVSQLSLINQKRADAVSRALQFANDVSDLNQFIILPAIITEEEKRHMIECKLLYCLGKNIENLRVDIARSDISTIARAIERKRLYGK